MLNGNKCLESNPVYSDFFIWNKVEADNYYFVFHPVNSSNLIKDIVKISSRDNQRWLTTEGHCMSSITQTNSEEQASY